MRFFLPRRPFLKLLSEIVGCGGYRSEIYGGIHINRYSSPPNPTTTKTTSIDDNNIRRTCTWTMADAADRRYRTALHAPPADRRPPTADADATPNTK